MKLKEKFSFIEDAKLGEMAASYGELRLLLLFSHVCFAQYFLMLGVMSGRLTDQLSTC